MNKHPFVLFLTMSRPMFVVAGMLFYALGAGIARYLGYGLDPGSYWLGQLLVSSIQLTAHYLNEYFDRDADIENNNRSLFSGGSGVLGDGEGKIPEQFALLAAASALTVSAIAFIGLGRMGVLNNAVHLIVILALLGAILYSLPPVRLVSSGFGELVASVILANLVPALAFILQSQEWHRLIAMTTFPLTALALATILSFEFPDYATDIKFAKRTLLVRLGWKQAIRFHAAFLLAAYSIMALSAYQGLPRAIAIPPLLTMPLALLQIWLFRGIEEGQKPNWLALTSTSVANTILVAYLYTYSFWTR
jgi:1,4-dihydroxy-2-naphthoate octaprenyltransferase